MGLTCRQVTGKSLSHLLKTGGTCHGAPICSCQRISKHPVVCLLNIPTSTPQSPLPWPRVAILGGAPYLHVPQELPPSQPPHLPGPQLTPRCLSLACQIFLNPLLTCTCLSSLSFLLSPTLTHTDPLKHHVSGTFRPERLPPLPLNPQRHSHPCTPPHRHCSFSPVPSLTAGLCFSRSLPDLQPGSPSGARALVL